MESTIKIWFEILAFLHTLFLHNDTISSFPWSNKKGGCRNLKFRNVNMCWFFAFYLLNFCQTTRASHQVFISNELSRTDLTQTTYLHMTEGERDIERLVEVLTLYNSDNFKENLKNYLLKTAMVKHEKRKQSALVN